MKKYKETLFEMRTFLLLWLTQAFSGLGSAMTSYCLVIWSYIQKGSALMTSLLMVCSYAPYVLFSIFAGALSDRWDKKKTMLACDTIAAATTVAMVVLLQNKLLQIWHLYLINVINGLMNIVQQPASEVAVTRLLPKKHYQRVGGLWYLSSSVNSILTPVIATAVLGLAGMGAVIAFDLFSFATAFLVLLFAIRIPEGEAVHTTEAVQTMEVVQSAETTRTMEGIQLAETAQAAEEAQPEAAQKKDSLLVSVGQGIGYLKKERGILGLILFLAAINLVASVYDAAFPAMLQKRKILKKLLTFGKK